MLKILARLFLLVLAASVVLVAGCGGGGSGAGTTTNAADYAVKVEVEPASIEIPQGDGKFEIAFTITNEGKKADTYALETGDDFFGKKVIGDAVPAELTLQPGESKVLSLPLTFNSGGTIAGGIDFDISVTAVSQADPAVTDQAACAATTNQ